MPSSQSEFPLTLAEVLFDELKSTRPDLAETQPNIVTVKAKLAEIQDLRTEEQVAQICQREGIEIEPTAETASERIWDCKYELSKRQIRSDAVSAVGRSEEHTSELQSLA